MLDEILDCRFDRPFDSYCFHSQSKSIKCFFFLLLPPKNYLFIAYIRLPPFISVDPRLPPFTSVYLGLSPFTSVFLRSPPFISVQLPPFTSVYLPRFTPNLTPLTYVHLRLPTFTHIRLCSNSSNNRGTQLSL